jgi:uncharacterized membrane protein
LDFQGRLKDNSQKHKAYGIQRKAYIIKHIAMNNMGGTDRIIRIFLAVIIAFLIYLEVLQSVLAYVLLALAAFFVLTSLVGFCPVYGLFGINSNKVKK